MKIFHPSDFLCANLYKLGKTGILLWYKYAYWRVRGKWPGLKKPKDLSEHILSDMVKSSFVRYADLADKVRVREYIKSKGLEGHLLDVYGAWETGDQINFDLLPNKFALKPNNGSGGHFFCHDKSAINIEEVRKIMDKSIVLENSAYHYEPHYFAIKPLIYAEELIDVGEGQFPIDYKFMCVKGKIGDISVMVNRDEVGGHKICRLDEKWNVLPYTKESYKSSSIPEKPKCFSEMVEIAKILSSDFECVRVDLYEYKDKVYFGELTFSPAGGILFSYNQFGLDEIGKLFNR